MDKLNLFDLFAKITLDTSEYEEGIEDSKKKSSTFFDVLKANLTSQAIIGGFQKISSAVTNFGKAALDGYAEYEQLVGGVDTLFKDSSQKLQQYAENAYKTAGMSANDYMSTVTSFSAALINSVGGDTEKAADMADRALTDMADNANKMGTSIDSIVGTYQSLSRGNYAMLDNLKLGYGGTKAELERLLEDAEAYKASMGEIVDYDVSSFADIVSGIGAIQEKMGIAGATADEAASTIEGSTNAMKAAWSNLVTGIGSDNADLELLVGNFIDSTVTAAGNVIPRIGIILQGIGEAVITAAPMAIQAGGDLIATLTDGAIGGIPDMLSRVPAIVESFLNFVTANLPAVLNKGVDTINSLVDGILAGVPDMLSRIPAVIDAFITFVADNGPVILLAGADVISNLVSGIIGAIPDMVVQLPKIITSFVETIKKNIPKVIETGFNVLMKLGDGVFDALPDLVARLPEVGIAILEAIAAALSGIVDIGANIVSGLWNGISSMGGWIQDKVSGFFSGIINDIKEFLGIKSPSKLFRDEIGQNIGLGVAEGLEDSKDDAVKAAEKLAESVYSKSKEWADRQTKYQSFSLQEQLEVWQAIQGQFIQGSKQYADAEEKIFDLRQRIQEEHQNKLNEYYDNVKEINQNIVDLEQNYQDALSSRAKEIFNSYGLFDEIPERQEAAGEDLISNLEKQISTLDEFYSGVEALTERGVGEDLVQEIREMGPNAVGQLNALLSLSDEKLSEYATLYKEKQELANSVAVEELKSLREDTNAQIADNMKSLQELYDQNAPIVGKSFTDGLAQGIFDGMSNVINSAVSVAESAVTAVKDALGIQSPSKVFASIGGYMAEGLGQGWENEFGHIKNQIEGGLNFGTGSVDFSSSGIGATSTGIINSLSAPVVGNTGTMTVNLVLPDGTTFARYQLPSLIEVAKANGTPILNPT